MTEPALAFAVETAQALANPARLRILLMLRDGSLSACQLAAVLGLARSSVSAHLAELERIGFLRKRRLGKLVSYALDRTPATSSWLRVVARSALGDPLVSRDTLLSRELRAVPPEALVPCGTRSRPGAAALRS